MTDIWEAAKKIEQEGKRFYEALARDASRAELAGVFTLLAGEEQRHYDTFVRLQKGAGADAAAPSDIVPQVIETLRKLTADFVNGVKAGDTEAAYRKALSLERRSVEHYEGMLAGQSGAAQGALKAIIAEEKRHEAIIDSLIRLVRRPREWVESAEFARLRGEEY